MILNTFTYFWCFLELFYWKFILNINNEHAQDYSCPGATFAFCSHGEKLPRKGGLPGVVQQVTRLSKLPRGNEKLMWTVTGVRPCTEAKMTPVSVSCPGAMSCPGIMWTGPKLLMNLTFSHVLRDQTFGLDLFTVNWFEDSKHKFLFNIDNAAKESWKNESKLFCSFCNGHFV